MPTWYTKSQADLLLSGKATPAQVSAAIAAITKTSVGLGNVDNTADANKPVSVPQQAAIDTAISALVNGASINLNQLNELAAAINNDPNYATTIATALATKAPLASPTFTGTVAAPTPPPGDTSTRVATTSYATAADAALAATIAATYVSFGPSAPDPSKATVWVDTSTIPQVVKGYSGTAWVAIGGNASANVVLTDNGNGTYTLSGPGVTDNGDGTFAVAAGNVTATVRSSASIANTFAALNGDSRLQIGVVLLNAAHLGADPAGAAAAITLAGLGGITPTAVDTKIATAAQTITSTATRTGTTYTFALADAGNRVPFSNASATTVTVPTNASVGFPIGARIEIAQKGAGLVTVAPASGVTIDSRGAALKMGGQHAVAMLTKIATDTWELTGDVTT